MLYRFDEPQNVAVRATSTDTMTDAGKAVADYLTSHQIIASKATGDNSYSYRSDDLLKQAQQLQEMSSATTVAYTHLGHADLRLARPLCRR